MPGTSSIRASLHPVSKRLATSRQPGPPAVGELLGKDVHDLRRPQELVLQIEDSAPDWAFLTNYAQALVCIAHDPGVRLRDIGARVGITERAAHRIVSELAAAGYIKRQRNGRRNIYTINAHLPLPDAIAREQSIGELLEILTDTRAVERVDHPGTSG